ncbi:MAG: mobile mystery protein B [Bacteroidales bacterium]|nr:mobile mystery protein B [Bacteroidales bacterium]
MGLNLEYINGQTPIDEEEKEELKIKTISSRRELDEFEQKNIEEAIEWTLRTNFSLEEILSEAFILKVHLKMFNHIWKWSGQIRKSNKNIGVDKYLIPVELRKVIDDCKYWIANDSFPPDEIAVRFKHRLVKTHIFPNGNGRHSRLCADILISHGFNRSVFSWGSYDLSIKGGVRTRYLEAIYKADAGNYEQLVLFARS